MGRLYDAKHDAVHFMVNELTVYYIILGIIICDS